MKRFLTIAAALALVLGLSQCRKPNTPTINGGNGETIVQHITVGATCNGGNSKVSGTTPTPGNALNLTWDAGDVLKVNRMDVNLPPKSVTLSEGAGTASGKFTNDEDNKIEGVPGTTKLAFVHGGSGARWGMQQGVLTIFAPQFKDQNGKIEKTTDSKASNKNSILDRLILFADNIDFIASSAAEYSADLEVPYAILKLDLSAFGTTAGTTVSISAGGSEVASVTGITTNSKEVYVALPAAESREYTFSGNNKTAKITWELNKNTYYTKTDGDGGSTGEAIVVTTPKFSVSATKTVEFSPGNLYWDGSEFKFEANQWDYRTWEGKPCVINGTYNATGTGSGHCGLFKWSDAASAVTNDFSCSGDLFCKNDFTVEGDTWSTLANGEWEYLLSNRTPTTTSANFKSLTIGGTSNTVSGLVILPDNSTVALNDITNTDDLAAAGAVFLPAAGYRNLTDVSDVGSNGLSWSSTTPNEDEAWYVRFKSDDVYLTSYDRIRGCAVRLVR